jgi:hypothetical protein
VCVCVSELVEAQRPTLCEDVSGILGAHETQRVEGLQALRAVIPSDECIRELFYDAHEVLIGCALHACNLSCYKYDSKGATHVCTYNIGGSLLSI